jgi:hypothetical protein
MNNSLYQIHGAKPFTISHDGSPEAQEQVAAVSGKKIVVVSYTLTEAAGATGLFKWQSFDGDETYTDLTGDMGIGAYGTVQDRDNDVGLFETLLGEALYLNTDQSLAGYGMYVEL